MGAIPSVSIIRGQGALGRFTNNQDNISGLIFFSDSLPAGFTTTLNIKQVLSLAAAEALGILGNLSDETKGTGTLLVTNAGASGDTVNVYFTEPNGTKVLIGSYTRASTDTTVALVATGIKNAINALSSVTGYTAAVATATVTITYRAGLGVFPNTGTNLSNTIVGTVASTLTQSVVAGVASPLNQFHYHIKEYYRLNPTGVLYVGFFPIAANAYDFAEIVKLQSFAGGKIRQVGVYSNNDTHWSTAANAATIANAAQAQKAILDAVHAPLSVICSYNLAGVSDFTTLTDLGTLSDNGVSITIGQDGFAEGFGIFKASGKSIGDVGAQLGAMSKVAVNQDQGCIQYVNYTDGVELAVCHYCNGVAVDLINASGLATQLHNYRYIYLMQNVGYTGTATTIVDNNCAVASSSDYAYTNDNRTFDKAHRLLYQAFVPELKSTLKLKEDGTLTADTIGHFKGVINQALKQMTTANTVNANQELAGVSASINANQNILSTGTLVIDIIIAPEGVARQIVLNLSF